VAGLFVLSLDTELAWGTFDERAFPRYRPHLERARGEIRRLLNLLEHYEISATWAFVGHLFLNQCERQEPGGDPHPDVLTPQYAWYPYHWHAADPGSDRVADPHWYGDDILDAVLAARPYQEIGCHTFSHIIMNDPAVTPAVVRSQLSKCLRLAAERDLQLRSFVFPRNEVAHLPVLSELGFSSYRGTQTSWYASFPGYLRPACHFVDRLLGLPPPTYPYPTIDSHGLVNVPASMFFMPPDGIRRLIPGWSRVRQAIAGLRRAAQRGELFHLWFHPWNLGSSPDMVLWLEKVFQTVSAMRARGELRVVTMGELAAEILMRTDRQGAAAERAARRSNARGLQAASPMAKVYAYAGPPPVAAVQQATRRPHLTEQPSAATRPN